MIYDIDMHEVSDEFAKCWRTAGQHLDSQNHRGEVKWLKAGLFPPFLEHLSFRLENQVFFIRIDDVDGIVRGPGNPDGFRIIAKGWNGHACRMPMQRKSGVWEPTIPGWGLIDDNTEEPIDPRALVSDEKIKMTDWELQDFAVQVVRDYIADELGRKLMSTQGNPDVDPSIWFVGENGPEWVAVRLATYPEKAANQPSNMADIAARCSRMSKIGHFASVAIVSPGDTSENGAPVLPLLRGHSIIVEFDMTSASIISP